MSRFNTLVDTNIFIAAKYNFAGGSLYNLKKYCADGIVALFTNDIILREVQSHIDEDVDMMARQAKNAIKQPELKNAITQDAYETIEATIMGATDSLRAQFDEYMKGATLLSNQELSIEELFDGYFEKTAPFENNETKKCEFPDAAIIMSIKRYMAENPGMQLCVVSNDNGWHNALKDTEGILLYSNLRELLDRISEEEDLYAQIIQYMKGCIAELRESAEEWCVCQDWSAIVDDNIDACIECDELVDIYVSALDLAPDCIEYIDYEDEFASALFSGVVTFYLGFDYIDHANEVFDREDRAYYNTIYGMGSAEVKVSFTGAVTILISDNGKMELNSSEFDEVIVEDVEILDYELTPYRKKDEPYFNVCADCGLPIGIHKDGGNGFCTNCAEYH